MAAKRAIKKKEVDSAVDLTVEDDSQGAVDPKGFAGYGMPPRVPMPMMMAPPPPVPMMMSAAAPMIYASAMQPPPPPAVDDKDEEVTCNLYFNASLVVLLTRMLCIRVRNESESLQKIVRCSASVDC